MVGLKVDQEFDRTRGWGIEIENKQLWLQLGSRFCSSRETGCNLDGMERSKFAQG